MRAQTIDRYEHEPRRYDGPRRGFGAARDRVHRSIGDRRADLVAVARVAAGDRGIHWVVARRVGQRDRSHRSWRASGRSPRQGAGVRPAPEPGRERRHVASGSRPRARARCRRASAPRRAARDDLRSGATVGRALGSRRARRRLAAARRHQRGRRGDAACAWARGRRRCARVARQRRARGDRTRRGSRRGHGVRRARRQRPAGRDRVERVRRRDHRRSGAIATDDEADRGPADLWIRLDRRGFGRADLVCRRARGGTRSARRAALGSRRQRAHPVRG